MKPQDSLISPIFKIYTQVDIIPNRIGTPSTTSHTHTKLIIYGKMHLNTMVQFNSVQFSRLPKDCSMPGFPVHHQLPEFTQTHVRWVGNAIQPSHPLSSPSPPAFNLSKHQGLSTESVLCNRWPKYWSFHFSISPSSEYSGLISLRMDWLDLLAVQGTLKSLLQHHSSKASILRHSAFLYSPILTSIHDYWLLSRKFRKHKKVPV